MSATDAKLLSMLMLEATPNEARILRIGNGFVVLRADAKLSAAAEHR
jgi:hypothetical protein